VLPLIVGVLLGTLVNKWLDHFAEKKAEEERKLWKLKQEEQNKAMVQFEAGRVQAMQQFMATGDIGVLKKYYEGSRRIMRAAHLLPNQEDIDRAGTPGSMYHTKMAAINAREAMFQMAQQQGLATAAGAFFTSAQITADKNSAARMAEIVREIKPKIDDIGKIRELYTQRAKAEEDRWRETKAYRDAEELKETMRTIPMTMEVLRAEKKAMSLRD
jgi:hypothetical protein